MFLLPLEKIPRVPLKKNMSNLFPIDPIPSLHELLHVQNGNSPTETLAYLEQAVTDLLTSPISRQEPIVPHGGYVPEKLYCRGVMAIGSIAANKLYRFAEPHKFTGLESYFRARFNLSRAQVYRFLNCSVVVTDLLNAPAHMVQYLRPLPHRQRVAKAIKDLASSPYDRQMLWATVLAHQPAGVDVTSTDVYRVARLIENQRLAAEPPVSPVPTVISESYPSPPRERRFKLPFTHHVSSPSCISTPESVYPSPVMNEFPDKSALPDSPRADTSALQCLAQVALDALSAPPLRHSESLVVLTSPVPSPTYFPPVNRRHDAPSSPAPSQWHCHLPSIHQVLALEPHR